MRLRSAGRVVLKAAIGMLGFLLVGNLVIYAMSAWARNSTPTRAVADVEGVKNLQVVDDRLWRGAAPTAEGYRALADRGATTIVDLRAEDGIEDEVRVATDLGMNVVRIPVRDGQAPTEAEVQQFLTAVREAPGTVFVNCGAGVGRTGAMVASYLVGSGGADASSALRRNLAVGPPSLEQVAYVAGLRDDRMERPHIMVTAVSRALDAPRRLLSRL